MVRKSLAQSQGTESGCELTFELQSWAVSQGSVRPSFFQRFGMFSAFRGEVPSSWAVLTVSDSPSHLHYAFSKPTCFLSGAVNLLLRSVILLSFYSTLFWAIICVAIITDFLAVDKLKGLGCLGTAAQLCPSWCIDVGLPVWGGSRNLDQLFFQNCTSVTEPGIIRLQLFLPIAGCSS